MVFWQMNVFFLLDILDTSNSEVVHFSKTLELIYVRKINGYYLLFMMFPVFMKVIISIVIRLKINSPPNDATYINKWLFCGSIYWNQ